MVLRHRPTQALVIAIVIEPLSNVIKVKLLGDKKGTGARKGTGVIFLGWAWVFWGDREDAELIRVREPAQRVRSTVRYRTVGHDARYGVWRLALAGFRLG